MASAVTVERQLTATLHEIGFNSAEPERLASFYETAFGLQFFKAGSESLGSALDRRLTIRPGQARTLAYAAYAVPEVAELAALERRLSAADVSREWVELACFEGNALRFSDPDGNRFVFGMANDRPSSVADTVSARPARLQHVVFASTDAKRLLSFFVDVVGFTLSDRVLDEHGGLRTAFVRCSHEHHSLAMFAGDENRLDHHCYEAEDWGLIRDWADHFAFR